MTTAYRPAVPPASRPEPVRLKARKPADLLAAVPFLLGFHPTESLVALLLAQGRVQLAARYDLGVPGVVEVVEQHRPAGVLLVAYCADVERGRAELRRSGAALAALNRPPELVDLLLVDGRRWWSLQCDCGCCPPEGTPYAPQDHPLSAEAVWAGLVAQPDRAAVVARVTGPTPGSGAELGALAAQAVARIATTSREERQDALARAVVRALAGTEVPERGAPPIDDATCAELTALVQDVWVRDVACALVTREDAARHLALWQAVVARAPAALAPAPLCLLGVAAWADGNGTLLNACCDRLAGLDPAYPMGRLLSDVSRRALPPAWWDAMADGLRRDLGLQA